MPQAHTIRKQWTHKAVSVGTNPDISLAICAGLAARALIAFCPTSSQPIITATRRTRVRMRSHLVIRRLISADPVLQGDRLRSQTRRGN